MAFLLAAVLALVGAGAVAGHRLLAADHGGDTAARALYDDRADRERADRGTSSPNATTAEPTVSTSTVSAAPSTPVARPAPVTTTPPAPVRTTAPRPATSTSQIQAVEDEVTALVNQERAKAGCAAVRTDERLRTAARAHSTDMATYGYFSHTGRDGSSFGDRAARVGYPSAIGENIAYGYRSAAEVMRAWMSSPGHRANILNCTARAVGTGLAYARDGTPYWTQLFGSV